MPWPKGRPHSAETRRKLSLAGRGKQRGEENPAWKGGERITSSGYVHVRAPDHPAAVSGYVPKHRLIMERHLGRFLSREEHVHHVDGDRLNNALDNLALVTPAEHMRIHHLGAKRSAETKAKISAARKRKRH